MEPISLILAALAAGATGAAKDTAGTAVKDAYESWLFGTWYGSIWGHKSTKSLSGKRFN
ncbi:hypothetical protein [Microcystis aeruginosa]|nr:hypothetical protein [Microcystis aeruginosa]ELS48721.1 hypothetical protein C789_1482 [Microcystis aeruginosa FACHB-905 = DIANCHI905]UGS11483.1 hypothetical protein LRR78_11360 [Microcystis aeruginosa FACHB-905 = DIANCHI905]WKX62274.1 hypothetical protein Q3H53_002270 [Microcystis aeruginosa PCC 7806]